MHSILMPLRNVSQFISSSPHGETPKCGVSITRDAKQFSDSLAPLPLRRLADYYNGIVVILSCQGFNSQPLQLFSFFNTVEK